MRLARVFSLVLVALLVTILIGCRSAPIMNIYSTPVPQTSSFQASLEQVERAIVAAAAELGWSTQLIKPGTMEAKIVVRGKHTAVVKIEYTTEEFSITYKYSEGLRYDGTNIHPNYNSWVKNLENRIKSKMVMMI